ncbi:restriction endonuclease [Nocardia fluminea]|uniref:restriction endonuclease n=1 Tax=Nocardia fluminea TaxID=134984 RepID=UPI003426A802
MKNCKHCASPLYLTLDGKCRICRRNPGFFRSMGATTTFTQGGAERAIRRDLNAQIGKVERDLANDLEQLYQTPVIDGLHGMTWQAAEIMARDWMKQHGHLRAKLTPSGPDGGVDVESLLSIAQVKHHASPVGLAEMQRLYGIAQSTKKKALFFAASGYSANALVWAQKHKIECYVYPPIKRVRA